MECEEFLSQLWEYLDRELRPEDSVSMGKHLASCSSCYPTYCCDRTFLELLARQRRAGAAPSSLVVWARRLSN
jgi:mycothiol system anti-sigma-R factor